MEPFRNYAEIFKDNSPEGEWGLFNHYSLNTNTLPVYSMETNTALTAALDDAARVFGKLIQPKIGDEKNVASRFGFFLGKAYLHWASTFYSHEIGHKQSNFNRAGANAALAGLNWENWDKGVPFLRGSHAYSRDNISRLRSTVNGLNQQEFNSDYYFRKSVLNDKYDLDDAISYTFSNMADVAYHTFFRDLSSGDIRSLHAERYFILRRSVDDNKWAVLSTATALASYHTWESLTLMAGYVSANKQVAHPVFGKTKDVKIYPPNFSFHVTPFDYFIMAETPLKLEAGAVLFANIGSTVEYPANPVRFGISAFFAHNRDSELKLTSEPQIFFNLDHQGLLGFLLGYRVSLEFCKTLEISFAATLHRGDYVNEDIKGYGITFSGPPEGDIVSYLVLDESDLSPWREPRDIPRMTAVTASTALKWSY